MERGDPPPGHDLQVLQELRARRAVVAHPAGRLRHDQDGRHARRVGLLLQAERPHTLAAGGRRRPLHGQRAGAGPVPRHGLGRRLRLPARAVRVPHGHAVEREDRRLSDARARVEAREEPRGARQGAAPKGEEAGRVGGGRHDGEQGAVGGAAQGGRGEVLDVGAGGRGRRRERRVELGTRRGWRGRRRDSAWVEARGAQRGGQRRGSRRLRRGDQRH
mmetsp:Transcript_38570/g.96270  ORF Transcript_38570/g.96270 Transcript_38570/m.96270 type:complete len:218 (-) Transcript_38570:362-1015(-)